MSNMPLNVVTSKGLALFVIGDLEILGLMGFQLSLQHLHYVQSLILFQAGLAPVVV